MAKKERNVVSENPERENPVLVFVTPKIDEARWDEIQGRVWDVLRYNVVGRAQLDENLLVWNDLYEGVVPQSKEWPWPNAANLHVPITSEMLDGLHSRLSKASLGVSPLMLVKAKDKPTLEIQAKLERYYDDFTKKQDIDDIVSESIFLSLRDGIGLMKVGWEERKRKVKVRKYIPITDELGEPVSDPKTGKPAYRESVEIEDLTEFDNVRVVPVELKDFYLIPGHAYTLDRFGSGASKGAAHRIWIRLDEIKRRANAGLYRQEAVDKLRDNLALERTPDTDVTIEGQIQLIQPYEDEKEFELFEVFMSYDLDEDGYDEECRFVFAFKWGILLAADIYPYWHQRRPFIAIIPWHRPRRFYGFSVVQRLEAIQRELNTIHNQRVDTVTLYLSPPLKIARSAIIRGDVSQAWGPGARMEVEDMKDIEIMQAPEVNPSAWTEENLLRQYAERQLGFFDTTTPRGTGSRKTRSEISATQQETMIRFDYMMKHLKRGVVDLYNMIHQLKIQYMPEEEQFESGDTTAEGLPDQMTMTRQEMTSANFEFISNGDLPVADEEKRREEAYFFYNTLNPSMLIQSNILRQYYLAKALCDAYGRRDTDNLIGTRDEAMQMMQAQQQQQQQQQAMMQTGAPGAALGGGQGGAQARPQATGGAIRQPGMAGARR